jgi:hypothetical protein
VAQPAAAVVDCEPPLTPAWAQGRRTNATCASVGRAGRCSPPTWAQACRTPNERELARAVVDCEPPLTARVGARTPDERNLRQRSSRGPLLTAHVGATCGSVPRTRVDHHAHVGATMAVCMRRSRHLNVRVPDDLGDGRPSIVGPRTDARVNVMG